jgi:hypothetical protein
MMRRQVTIAKDIDIDCGLLAIHPLVVKRWKLARGYMLFEYYHPAFDKTCDSDYESARLALQTEPYKSQDRAVRLEWRRLLSPAYAGGQGDHMFVVTTRIATYWFEGRERYTMAWPRVGFSKQWDSSSRIRIAGRLFLAEPETIAGLQAVLSEWHETVPGQVVQAGPLIFSGEGFNATYEFSGPCGDATIALFMLLTVTRHLTSLEAAGFFLEDDFATPYFHPRGDGDKMPQTGWPLRQEIDQPGM